MERRTGLPRRESGRAADLRRCSIRARRSLAARSRELALDPAERRGRPAASR
jgi:hypothetical protein